MQTFSPPKSVHRFLRARFPNGFFGEQPQARIDIAALQPRTLKALLADTSIDATTKRVLERMLTTKDDEGGDDFVASSKRAAAQAALPAGQPIIASFDSSDDDFVSSCARAASR